MENTFCHNSIPIVFLPEYSFVIHGLHQSDGVTIVFVCPGTFINDTNIIGIVKFLGNSYFHIQQFVIGFIIIAVGIVVGSIPIPVGMKAPVKLGLAGGPLVVAIIFSWLGVRKGWFTTEYTDSHGVWMLREVGIALFLAGVGLGAGGQFTATVQEHYMWIVYGVVITVVPPVLIGLFGRLVLKMNYYTLMGFIGGSHTDPPTLAFANTMAPEGCKLPNLGYATVYPLTMFLRIFSAQLLVLLAV